jgi:adenylate cyclase
MEIERKFLVVGDYKPFSSSQVKVVQAYLSKDPERTVRVRIWGKKGFLTIKGKSNKSGMSRFEWEKEISLEEAIALLQLCMPVVIEKTRYLIPEKGGLTFEVDEFHGSHQGLVLAEIELPKESTVFDHPEWLGEEVTGNANYYNSHLSSHPQQ